MYMEICGRGKLAFMQSSRKVCKAWRLDAAQVFVVKFDYSRGEGGGGSRSGLEVPVGGGWMGVFVVSVACQLSLSFLRIFRALLAAAH